MRPNEIAWDSEADLPPFAAGFRTCEEVLEDIQLEITGEIPAYVNGKLFRNGPGVFEATHKNGEVSHINHWFDGISAVHRFVIDGASGTVMYRNRRTGREMLEAMEAAPSKAAFKMVTFGNQDPCRGLLGNLFQMWRPLSRHPTTGCVPNNVGVTLERVPTLGSLVSRTDYNRAEVLDIDTLECTRNVRFGELNPQLSGMATAAHGVVDPDSGAYMNYTYAHGLNPEYHVFEVTTKETRTLARFRDHASYMHSIAATKNYVVLILYSVVVNAKGGLKAAFGESSFMEILEFDPTLRTKFYVVSRAEERLVAVYDADPFFCFHQVNAFEDSNGNVMIDLGRYKNGDVLNWLYRRQLMGKKMEPEEACVPTRFQLSDIATAAEAYKNDGKAVAVAAAKKLCDVDIELMRVAPSVEMRPYRYTYGVSSNGAHASLFNSLVKVDVHTGAKLFYTPPNAACGEPIFVPDPNGMAEDDGVLLSVVLDLEEAKSYMAVLNAGTMEEMGRAKVPQAVPLGFHGQYMTEDEAQRIRGAS